MADGRDSDIPPLERMEGEKSHVYFTRLAEYYRRNGGSEVQVKAARGMSAALSPGCIEGFFQFSYELRTGRLIEA